MADGDNPFGLSNSDIGGIGLGATIGGTMLSAFGSLTSGFSNKAMFDYQSGVARLNQQIFQQDAEWSRQVGEQQSVQVGLKGKAQMGQITAAQASSGLDIRSGSAVQVRAGQAKMTQLDTDVVRSDAAKTAYNYEVQATTAGAQSEVYKAAGSNALEAGFIGAGSSILGGIGSVSSMWLQGSRVGLWGGAGGGAGASTDDNIGAY